MLRWFRALAYGGSLLGGAGFLLLASALSPRALLLGGIAPGALSAVVLLSGPTVVALILGPRFSPWRASLALAAAAGTPALAWAAFYAVTGAHHGPAEWLATLDLHGLASTWVAYGVTTLVTLGLPLLARRGCHDCGGVLRARVVGRYPVRTRGDVCDELGAWLDNPRPQGERPRKGAPSLRILVRHCRTCGSTHVEGQQVAHGGVLDRWIVPMSHERWSELASQVASKAAAA